MLHDSKLCNPEVRIEVTNRCNTHCIMCPREKLSRPLMTMDNAKFKNILVQAYELGAELISPFGYGEPLLDPDLATKISYCTTLGLKTFITTNGSLLDTDLALKLLDAGLSHIRFSFSGTSPEEYRRIHGLLYHKTIINVRNFIAMNKFRYGNYCKVDVTTIGEIEDIDAIKLQWPDVDLLEIWRPHNWTDGRQYRNVKKKRKSCNRPFTGPLQIQVDGTMIVCCFDFNGQMSIGDTQEKKIVQILLDEPLKKIKIAHQFGNLDGLICSNCDQLNIEEISPLIYSSVGDTKINRTAGAKFNLGD